MNEAGGRCDHGCLVVCGVFDRCFSGNRRGTQPITCPGVHC
jgi:hypothetical protein